MKKTRPSPSTRIERGADGELRVVVVAHPVVAFLEPIEAEILLYSLSADVNTLRGIRKKLGKRDRVRTALRTLRG